MELLLEGGDPPPQKQYPPREALAEVGATIAELEQRGLIWAVASPCNAAVWPVRKPNGTWCLTGDYRALNALANSPASVVAAYPEMLARIGPQFRIFTVLDIANGFWSLPLATSCQYKTAFTWEGRQFCWTVLPQGYRDSPAIFQRYMRQALEGVDSARCIQYVDDLLLMSGTEEEDRELTK
ncbi:unnamed protein product [Natator depressus]